VLEFLPWIKEIDRQLVDIERVARWCGAVGVSCTWNQLAENSRDPSRATRILEQAHALHADGCRVYGQVSPRPFDLHVSFDQTPAFVAIPAWGRFIALPTAAEKRAMLADAEWRAAARADWDRVGDGFTIFPVSRLDRVRLTSVREGEERFLDSSFADVVAARGGHPSDVLADWVLEHDLAPGMVAEALSNNNAEKVSELIADDTTVVGASDAGAHLQMMCGAGDSTLVLSVHVRDRGDLTVEQGVHQLTGRIAEVFGIRDRGVLAPGLAGDISVFALDELGYRPDRTVHDLPGGAPRLTRPAGGFRYTAVAGVVTQEAGVATGARPGGPLDAG
jgi:N-acyl-D-aspartate/D-glutamate deacylase